MQTWDEQQTYHLWKANNQYKMLPLTSQQLNNRAENSYDLYSVQLKKSKQGLKPVTASSAVKWRLVQLILVRLQCGLYLGLLVLLTVISIVISMHSLHVRWEGTNLWAPMELKVPLTFHMNEKEKKKKRHENILFRCSSRVSRTTPTAAPPWPHAYLLRVLTELHLSTLFGYYQTAFLGVLRTWPFFYNISIRNFKGTPCYSTLHCSSVDFPSSFALPPSCHVCDKRKTCLFQTLYSDGQAGLKLMARAWVI